MKFQVRAGRLLAILVAALLTALVLAGGGLAANPTPKGVYIGTLVNSDTIQLNVSADGKSATAVVGCLDMGESYPFPRFPIVNGAFNVTLSAPGEDSPEAKLRGMFKSATQVSIVINEHPDKSRAARYLCFGITSPATLALKKK